MSDSDISPEEHWENHEHDDEDVSEGVDFVGGDITHEIAPSINGFAVSDNRGALGIQSMLSARHWHQAAGPRVTSQRC